MKITNLYIALVLMLCVVSLSAQQDPNYTFYRYNMNLINPAFAGAGGETGLGINIRSQWANVEGAPETQSFIFGTPMGKNIGLGVSIINDKTFIENQTSLSLDFSYKLTLNDEHDLYFGLKAGFNSYDANTEGLTTYGVVPDPSLMNLDGQFSPNIGAGVYIKNKDYFIAFSIPSILTPDRLEENSGTARLSMAKTHMYLAGGYNVPLSSSIILKPTALMRYVDASPLSLDLTAMLEFSNRFDLGAAYRLNESVSGIFIFKTKSWLEIGYAYEVAFESPVRNIDNGTHEILFNLKL
ncbi:MAG: hypothetical protein COA50_08765 [Flavobacteriaceae bacterium]|nr:MAG: hypothetical protein COA50_08765 [Flavobacteriaceae bacterium]